MKISFVNIPLFVILAVILFCTGATAGDNRADASKSAQWVEDAKKCGLSSADIDLLNTNRILISNKTYKQIFSAYISGERPLFITTDSLLNAYHVLYEESILRLENTLAGRLPGILRLILENIHDADRQLKGNPALVSSAKQRATLTIGIALKLVDDTFQFDDKKLNSILEEEIKRIKEAKAIAMPVWLGKPDASFTALDYSRYKPRGFYLRSERLQRNFRAVSWLQSIPFRIGNDIELLSILMLGNSMERIQFGKISDEEDFDNFFRAYNFFIGVGDDWDLITAENYARLDLRMDLDGNDLRKERAQLEKSAEKYGEVAMINGQIRFTPGYPENVAQPQFRIISQYRTPDAILFQRTTDPRHFNRPYPNGLEVVASLGSTFARQYISESGEEGLLKTIDSCKRYFDYQSLNSEYSDNKEKYFLILQNQNLYLQYLYVLKALLGKPEVDAPDFMKTKAWEAKNCNTALSGWAQLRHTWVLHAKQSVSILLRTKIPTGFVEPEPEFFLRIAGLANTTREFLNYLGAFNTGSGYTEEDIDLEDLWVQFEIVSRRLEAITHKQLRDADLNTDETFFIRSYGTTIAKIMLYSGNSYLSPKDDSPRIVDVYANPQTGGYLHVGIARPRKLYVLYPWKGETVLCEGAIMPYSEFVSAERLTDESWKAKLDSGNNPPVPKWLSPIIVEGGLGRPDKIKKEK